MCSKSTDRNGFPGSRERRGRPLAAGVEMLCLLLVTAAPAGCRRGLALPEGFSGAEASNMDDQPGPDLWLVRKGRSISGACADTTSDGMWNIALRERYGEISLEIDGDQDARPEFKGYLRVGTTEDFRRVGPDLMVNPNSRRPAYARQLQYEAGIGSRRSIEVLNVDSLTTARLDNDGDGFRETVVSRRDGRLVEVKCLRRGVRGGEGEPFVWMAFSEGQPSQLGWKKGKSRIVWDVGRDEFSVDKDGDGRSEEVFSAQSAPKPDAYRAVLDSFTEVVGKLVGAR